MILKWIKRLLESKHDKLERLKKEQEDDTDYASLFEPERHDKFIKAHFDFFAELKRKGYLKDRYEK